MKPLRKLHHRFFSPGTLRQRAICNSERRRGPGRLGGARPGRLVHAGRTWAVHRVNCTGKHLNRLSYLGHFI